MVKVTYAKCYADNQERIFGPFPSMDKATAYVLEHHPSLRWDFYYVTMNAEESPKIQDFQCVSCDAVTEAWDMPSQCPVCEHPNLMKLLPMPALYGLEGSASFLDGTRRKGFAEMKEASKLEVQMLDTHPKKRAEMQAEVNKLKGAAKT
jgi:hypothetical protein